MFWCLNFCALAFAHMCVCLKFFLFVLTVHVCIERWQSLLLCVQACFGFVIVCDYDRTMQTNWFSDTDTSYRDCACTHMCACMFCLLKMLTTYQCVSVRVCACMCHSSSQSVISSDGWGWHFIYRTWTSTRTFRSVAVDGFDPLLHHSSLWCWNCCLTEKKKVGTCVIFKQTLFDFEDFKGNFSNNPLHSEIHSIWWHEVLVYINKSYCTTHLRC